MAKSPRVWARRCGCLCILLASIAVSAAPGRAVAADRLDLATTVLTHLDGFTVAPPGVGLTGPVTAEQLARFVADPEVRDWLADGRVYARTFVGTAGREAGIMAFDFGSRAEAHAFLALARQGMGTLAVVVHIPGLEAFRTVVPPEKAANRSTQEVFLQVGRVGFILVLSDRITAPVTDADATDLALAQVAAVPAEVATAKDERSRPNAAYRAGEAVGTVVGVMTIVGVAGAVVLSRKRHLG